MKRLLLFIIISTLFSCSSNSKSKESTNKSKRTFSNLNGITPEEYFTKKTGKFYACNASYKTNKINGKTYLTITLNSNGLVSLLSPELVTSRVCFESFYQLRDSSSISYDIFQCKIIQKNGKVLKDSYSSEQLELFELKSEIIKKFNGYLESSNYDKLYTLFSPELAENSPENLKSTFEPLNSKYGNIKITRLVGFTKYFKFKIKEKGIIKELFGIKIAQQREREIVTIGIVMSTNKDDNYIYGID